MRKLLAVTFLLAIIMSSNAQIADKVIKNSKIYTADASDTFVQALAIKDGEIIYAGTDAGVSVHIGSGTEVKNGGGRLILPGMHDVHMHPLEASSPMGLVVV